MKILWNANRHDVHVHYHLDAHHGVAATIQMAAWGCGLDSIHYDRGIGAGSMLGSLSTAKIGQKGNS